MQVQTCHESQAVNQKWQGIVFTLLENSRNHCTVGHSYLCNSIPSALPMLSTLLHADHPFLDLYRMKCSSPASLCGGFSHHSGLSLLQFCFVFCKEVFQTKPPCSVVKSLKHSHPPSVRRIQRCPLSHYYSTFSKSTSQCNCQKK